MKTIIPQSINTVDDVKGFFAELIKNDEDFHPEDRPSEVIDGRTGRPLFTEDEAQNMEAAMKQVWKVCEANGIDPCDLIMAKDLFETPELWPAELAAILDKYAGEDQLTYKQCESLIKKLNDIGYTCDYGLDGVPYDLRKVKSK